MNKQRKSNYHLFIQNKKKYLELSIPDIGINKINLQEILQKIDYFIFAEDRRTDFKTNYMIMNKNKQTKLYSISDFHNIIKKV